MKCKRKSEPIDFVRLDNTSDSILMAVEFAFGSGDAIQCLDIKDSVIERVRKNGGFYTRTDKGSYFVNFGDYIVKDEDHKIIWCSHVIFNDLFEVITE